MSDLRQITLPAPTASRKGAGRPTALTPELAQEITALVADGTDLRQAAAMVGIARRTVEDWLKRGLGEHPSRPQTPLYQWFASGIMRAERLNERGLEQVLRDIAEDGEARGSDRIAAATKLLDRKHPTELQKERGKMGQGGLIGIETEGPARIIVKWPTSLDEPASLDERGV